MFIVIKMYLALKWHDFLRSRMCLSRVLLRARSCLGLAVTSLNLHLSQMKPAEARNLWISQKGSRHFLLHIFALVACAEVPDLNEFFDAVILTIRAKCRGTDVEEIPKITSGVVAVLLSHESTFALTVKTKDSKMGQWLLLLVRQRFLSCVFYVFGENRIDFYWN